MDPRALHLICTYCLLCIGTTALWLGETSDVLPYPAVVVACSVVAYLYTDRKRIVQFSVWVSNMVALVLTATIVAETANDRSINVMTLAHFLVYLQVAKGFREKRSIDFWMLYVVSILQVIVGCVVNRTVGFGFLLLLYVACGLLVLGLHELVHKGFRPIDGHRGGGSSPYRRLGWRAGLAAIAVTTVAWSISIPVALASFWVIPRLPQRPDVESSENVMGSSTTSAGLSNDIDLSNVGSILDNDDVVLNVECRSGSGAEVPLPPGLRWRGFVFTTYQDRQWRPTPDFLRGPLRRLPAPVAGDPSRVELRIELLMNSGRALLSPRPAYSVRIENEGQQAYFVPFDGRIITVGGGRGRAAPEPSRHYVLTTDAVTRDAPSPFETEPSPAYLEHTRQVPNGLERLGSLARQLTGDVDEADTKARINQVRSYLADSGAFDYSLDNEPVDATIDPVEDFLFNRKEGHCEFFASAMALMLREIGVASRVVNGFVGATSSTGGQSQVRQMQAHSWVEAYLPDERIWMTVDPTPELSREAAMARSLSLMESLREFAESISRWWYTYVIGFGDAEQSGFVSIDPQRIRSQMQAAGAAVAQNVSDAMPWRSNPGMAMRNAAMLLGMLASLAAAIFAARGAIRSAFARRSRRRESSSFVARCDVYEDWLKLLSRTGWRRRSSQTAWEFSLELAKSWCGDQTLRNWSMLPQRLTSAYYAVRFGRKSISMDEIAALRLQIAAIADHLMDDRKKTGRTRRSGAPA